MTAGKPLPRTAAEFGPWFIATAEAAGYKGHGWKRRLAEDSKVDESTVGRYTLSGSRPGTAACRRLAPLLKITADEMLAAAGHKDPDAAPVSLPRYNTEAGEWVDTWLAGHAEDDPQRRHIEAIIEQLRGLAEAGKGTAG